MLVKAQADTKIYFFSLVSYYLNQSRKIDKKTMTHV